MYYHVNIIQLMVFKECLSNYYYFFFLGMSQTQLRQKKKS